MPLLNDIKFKGKIERLVDGSIRGCMFDLFTSSLIVHVSHIVYLPTQVFVCGVLDRCDFKGEPQIGLHDPAGQNVEIKALSGNENAGAFSF